MMREFQQNLKNAGFDPGPIDGVWGGKTCFAAMGYAAGRQLDASLRGEAQALAAEMVARFIDRPLRIAHFLATLVIESDGFRRMTENLTYTKPSRLDALFSAVKGEAHAAQLIAAGATAIANCVYANRNGNGGEASGDGWRYIGRGRIQLTGRANYRDMGRKLGVPLEEQPGLASEAAISARVAGRYWADKGLNAFADLDDAGAIRARVNGPRMEGLSDTRRIATKILNAFGGAQ